jgi:hypothetical protein
MPAAIIAPAGLPESLKCLVTIFQSPDWTWPTVHLSPRMTAIIQEPCPVLVLGLVLSCLSFYLLVTWRSVASYRRARVLAGCIQKGNDPEFCLMAPSHKALRPNRPWDGWRRKGQVVRLSRVQRAGQVSFISSYHACFFTRDESEKEYIARPGNLQQACKVSNGYKHYVGQDFGVKKWWNKRRKNIVRERRGSIKQ